MLYHFSAAQKFPTIDRKVTVLLAGTLNIAHAIKAVFLYSFQTCVRFDLIKSSTAMLTYNSTQTCSPQTSAGTGERECSQLSPRKRPRLWAREGLPADAKEAETGAGPQRALCRVQWANRQRFVHFKQEFHWILSKNSLPVLQGQGSIFQPYSVLGWVTGQFWCFQNRTLGTESSKSIS